MPSASQPKVQIPRQRPTGPGKTAGDRQAEAILALTPATMKTSELIKSHVSLGSVSLFGVSRDKRIEVEQKKAEIAAEIDKRLPVPAV